MSGNVPSIHQIMSLYNLNGMFERLHSELRSTIALKCALSHMSQLQSPSNTREPLGMLAGHSQPYFISIDWTTLPQPSQH